MESHWMEVNSMKLKESREATGMTQGAFAQQIGVNRFDYCKVEKGKFLPTPEQLGRICRALDKKPLELYERQEIDLLGALKMAPGRRSADRHKYHSRKVYRVPEEFATPFPADFWPTLGYRDYSPSQVDISSSAFPGAATGSVSKPRSTPEGQITVGSVCTASGKYYASSYGDEPHGNGNGRRCVVSRIISDPSRPYPIHITTESGGWLGWLKKSQLRVVG